MKFFLDQLIDIDELIGELTEANLSVDEVDELKQVIDEMFIHHSLNIILNHLPKIHHAEFTQLVISDPTSPVILEYAQSKVEVDLISELKSHTSKLKSDIKSEITKAKHR